MKLKGLELQGFKTFPDRTKLDFTNGITAVVGPNGSGKSNISDAIRWVLGEQSAKALRCSRMEDVIFNGTQQRKKTGYAQIEALFGAYRVLFRKHADFIRFIAELYCISFSIRVISYMFSMSLIWLYSL